MCVQHGGAHFKHGYKWSQLSSAINTLQKATFNCFAIDVIDVNMMCKGICKVIAFSF